MQKLRNLRRLIKDVNSCRLRVGVFSGATYEDGTSVAKVAIKNEFGTQGGNGEPPIPPRPFMRPTIANNSEGWGKLFNIQLKNNGFNAMNAMDVLGQVIEGEIRETMTQIIDPPLSAKTLHNRRTRTDKQKNFSDKPLIDTAVLIRSITSKVDKKT